MYSYTPIRRPIELINLPFQIAKDYPVDIPKVEEFADKKTKYMWDVPETDTQNCK